MLACNIESKFEATKHNFIMRQAHFVQDNFVDDEHQSKTISLEFPCGNSHAFLWNALPCAMACNGFEESIEASSSPFSVERASPVAARATLPPRSHRARAHRTHVIVISIPGRLPFLPASRGERQSNAVPTMPKIEKHLSQPYTRTHTDCNLCVRIDIYYKLASCAPHKHITKLSVFHVNGNA